MRSLNIAATGMLAQQMNVDVISNNLANLTTTAYKRQRAEFQDLLYQNITRAGTASSDAGTIVPTGIQLGLGVKSGAIYRISEQGTLLQTSSPFDVALSGRGYFQITLPTGEPSYTRDGSFQVNQNGELVTAQGFLVSPGISIPDDTLSIEINESGEVLATVASDPKKPQNVGQLDVVNFINEAGLQPIGNNQFTETEASGTPISGFAGQEGFGTIKQKFLEQGNVDSITEITLLITAQRSYELNSRVISTSDEMLQALSQLR